MTRRNGLKLLAIAAAAIMLASVLVPTAASEEGTEDSLDFDDESVQDIPMDTSVGKLVAEDMGFISGNGRPREENVRMIQEVFIKEVSKYKSVREINIRSREFSKNIRTELKIKKIKITKVKRIVLKKERKKFKPTPTITTPQPTATSTRPRPTATATPRHKQIQILKPQDGDRLHKAAVFQALIPGMNLDDYKMFWTVDNGGLNEMRNGFEINPPHKHYDVTFANWNWRADRKFLITFIAQDMQGREIARKSINIFAFPADDP